MTFFDLRMLAAELDDIDWSEQEEKEEKDEEKTKDSKSQNDDEAETKGTVVEISKLTRPGIALSGSVRFSSGATADWVLDQQGRLAFEKSEGKPTPEDLQEFQDELRTQISGGAGR